MGNGEALKNNMGNPAKKISSYRDLDVWQSSRRLVKSIYKLTKNFPHEEIFALTSQMRRAVISIPANIAEGFSRHGTKDYVHFLSIAIGSLAELETLLILAYDLEYISKKEVAPLYNELEHLHKMLQKMRQTLKSKL